MMQDRTVKGSHVIQAKDWIDSRLGPGTFGQLTKAGGDRWGSSSPWLGTRSTF